MATSALGNGDQPEEQGVAGPLLGGICQNPLTYSSQEAPLSCELTGLVQRAKINPEEMELRWLREPLPSVLLAPLRCHQMAASGFVILTGHMLAFLPHGAVTAVITSVDGSTAFNLFPTGKSQSQWPCGFPDLKRGSPHLSGNHLALAEAT
jgi:hypothetical protein